VSRRTRTWLFGLGASGLAALLGWAISGLPAFGHFNGAYALLINHVVVAQRHATDAITGVNFDYRALDTLGEEFILFTSVVAVTVLLREQRGEHERPDEEAMQHEGAQGSSFALRALALALVGPVLGLSFYVDSHGALTPGGGFQGGVIGAAALLMVFLGGSYMAMRRISPHSLVELAESSGAAAYALIGLGGMIFASTFFQNFLGYGTPGQLISAGTIPLNSLAVALEVTGAFVLLWREFLEQTLVVRPG
jgi:multicomponent Na+:H+ antiporter subunit B